MAFVSASDYLSEPFFFQILHFKDDVHSDYENNLNFLNHSCYTISLPYIVPTHGLVPVLIPWLI
ncbi:42899_t:CDS:2, partial [Gigaspora margarita]